LAALAAAVVVASSAIVAPAAAVPARMSELTSREAVLSWMLGYRARPAPAQVAGVMRTAARLGAFRDVDGAGVYVGFMAGALAAAPAKAADLVDQLAALPAEDHWAVVRAIAYSGLPHWQKLLRGAASRLPARRVMAQSYLAGRLPTLDQFAFAEDPGVLARMRMALSFKADDRRKRAAYEPHPDLIDTYWGYYYATGAYGPVSRLIGMLEWSNDRDSLEKLTLGNMAKYTLSLNAARDPELLALLKWARPQQRKAIATVLDDLIEAAETADTPRLRKEALAAIEELRRKGPGFKRDVSWWAQVGQGALSLGCLGAAVAGQVEFGIPCVIGGALSSAVLYYWNQPR
jgi:hypothetical protein